MSSVSTCYGFTGSIWEEPDIDSLSVETLLDTYTHLYFTIISDGSYYLGTRDDINTNNLTILARASLASIVSTVELESEVSLQYSQYKLVFDGVEVYNTVTLPSAEKIIINGMQFIATEATDGDTSRYVQDIANNMIEYQDPIIATTDLFYDVELLDITAENITNNFINSLLLLGGRLYETRSLYNYLTTTSIPKDNVSGWLPSLFKQISDIINPYEIGLTWPIQTKALSDIEVFNKIVAHSSSKLVVFNTNTPVSYERNRISRLFPSTIEGILAYDGRPSCNRVTELLAGCYCPDKNMLIPTLKDLDDSAGTLLTIYRTVEHVVPEEHLIKFVKYEVKE